MHPPAIYFWKYLLHSETALNSASTRRSFPGALIRQGDGFGCIHPWPEFGDLPLADQLDLLKLGRPTTLASRALECAALDAAARLACRSLLQDLAIPASHYSWNFGQPAAPQIERLLHEQWPALKAKGHPNWGETLDFLEICERDSGTANLRYRIDFNGCLNPASFQEFVDSMPPRVRRAIDFIEDPCPYDRQTWTSARQQLGVPLALDKAWQTASTGFDYVVIKPARRDWRTVVARHPGLPLVFTSAMDHPVGQMFAAYEAAVAGRKLGTLIGLCGLCTQHLFKPDAFLERVQSPGGTLLPDTVGGGLGFGDLLEHLPWRRLAP